MDHWSWLLLKWIWFQSGASWNCQIIPLNFGPMAIKCDALQWRLQCIWPSREFWMDWFKFGNGSLELVSFELKQVILKIWIERSQILRINVSSYQLDLEMLFLDFIYKIWILFGFQITHSNPRVITILLRQFHSTVGWISVTISCRIVIFVAGILASYIRFQVLIDILKVPV
jgi:hypothetical protein